MNTKSTLTITFSRGFVLPPYSARTASRLDRAYEMKLAFVVACEMLSLSLSGPTGGWIDSFVFLIFILAQFRQVIHKLCRRQKGCRTSASDVSPSSLFRNRRRQETTKETLVAQ